MSLTNSAYNIGNGIFCKLGKTKKKSRIGETKHLSTDADSTTDAIGGGRKIPQNPIFLKKEKSSKTQKLKKSRNMPKLVIRPSTRGL